MKIIGLTGSVGSGKSTVGKIMQEHFSVKLSMTDDIGHLAMEPGTESYEEIVKLLGNHILREDGTIDRKVVSDLVFSDKMLLAKLNGIIHPWVKEYLRKDMETERQKAEYAYYVIESAILFQTGLDAICEEVWYVDAEDSIRAERLQQNRGYSQEKIAAIMQNQSENEIWKQKCRKIIVNNEGMDMILQQLESGLASAL